MTKLLLPVKAKDGMLLEANSLDNLLIERRFGRTSYFVTIDSDAKSFELVKNNNNHNGGTAHTPDVIKDAGAEVVIAAHMGSHAWSGIREHGIKVLRGDLNMPLSVVVDRFNNNKLSEFEEPAEHNHHH